MSKKDPILVNESILKGRIGENIVTLLLRALGFEVAPNGYENTHPSYITHMKKGRLESSKIKKYRGRADLTVLREAGNGRESLFTEIEVKYSSRSYIDKNLLREYDNDVCFIFVDQHDFWSATKDQILSDKNAEKTYISFKSLVHLEDDPFYEFSTAEKKLIKDFKRFIGKYYADKNGEQTEQSSTQQPPAALLRESKPETAYPAKHGGPWSDDHNRRLLEYHKLMRRKYSQDKMIARLAKEFGRSEKAIRMRLEKLLSSS